MKGAKKKATKTQKRQINIKQLNKAQKQTKKSLVKTQKKAHKETKNSISKK